jgi:hypothetical protein
MKQVTSKVVNAFLVGKPTKVDNTQSTGRAMYLFGNKIAEWREDGLWITNCGWQTNTTKERLNGLGMYLNFWIAQRKGNWYITGNELGGETYWSGDWVRVYKHLPNGLDLNAKSKEVVVEKEWVSNGYRGYYDPTTTAIENIKECMDLMKKYGIKCKHATCETSNVFAVNHFVVVSEHDFEKAKHIYFLKIWENTKP